MFPCTRERGHEGDCWTSLVRTADSDMERGITSRTEGHADLLTPDERATYRAMKQKWVGGRVPRGYATLFRIVDRLAPEYERGDD